MYLLMLFFIIRYVAVHTDDTTINNRNGQNLDLLGNDRIMNFKCSIWMIMFILNDDDDDDDTDDDAHLLIVYDGFRSILTG